MVEDATALVNIDDKKFGGCGDYEEESEICKSTGELCNMCWTNLKLSDMY